MQERKLLLTALAGAVLLFAGVGRADVPPPPANQNLGMLDAAFSALTEADCRACHLSGVPDRHHGLYNSVIPSLTVVPYPEFNTPGATPSQELYSCLSCHSDNFILERDCTVCHNTASPHHQTALADAGDCVACHGDIVDNRTDGHYIPSYAPSLVTPTRSMGDADQINSYGNGAGACNYCHDQDVMPPGDPVLIQDNHDNHHGTNLVNFGSRCGWCHNFGLPFEAQIRVCENCHGPDSLHNIQTDSNGDGMLVVGGELFGYGHVGRDAGPNDSDCWGCHGFTGMSSAPASGPIIPSITHSDVSVVSAGVAAPVVLEGTAFSNEAGGLVFDSDVALTAADGSSVILTAEIFDEGLMGVTIPADTAPGNYDVRAVKADVASNPAVISVVPKVTIASATGDGRVTIVGTGFGGYAADSGTSVTGTVTGAGGATTTVEGTIRSWNDRKIKVVFDSRPSEVTVNSVYGSATSTLESVTMGGPGRRRKATR